MSGLGRRPLAVLGMVAAIALAGCGGATEMAAPTPGADSPATGEAPASSPVEGVVIGLQSEGLTRVIGFRLRTDAGQELDFAMGKLENGVEFPPGHLAEHMAGATRIRVFFRDDGRSRVAYRLEDAP